MCFPLNKTLFATLFIIVKYDILETEYSTDRKKVERGYSYLTIKMKKIVVFITLISIIGVMFAGCGSTAKEKKTTKATTAEPTTQKGDWYKLSSTGEIHDGSSNKIAACDIEDTYNDKYSSPLGELTGQYIMWFGDDGVIDSSILLYEDGSTLNTDGINTKLIVDWSADGKGGSSDLQAELRNSHLKTKDQDKINKALLKGKDVLIFIEVLENEQLSQMISFTVKSANLPEIAKSYKQ